MDKGYGNDYFFLADRLAVDLAVVLLRLVDFFTFTDFFVFADTAFFRGDFLLLLVERMRLLPVPAEFEKTSSQLSEYEDVEPVRRMLIYLTTHYKKRKTSPKGQRTHS